MMFRTTTGESTIDLGTSACCARMILTIYDFSIYPPSQSPQRARVWQIMVGWVVEKNRS